MFEKNSSEPVQRVLAGRPAGSRKLLARKARASISHSNSGPALESDFPEPLAPSDVGPTRHCPLNAQQQKLGLGKVQPNPNTVVAVIVGIVAARGDLGRAELIEAMGASVFPHSAARPRDRSW